MVTQLTILEGMWSRKISHSARPRNKSNRRSRTAGFGNNIRLPSTGTCNEPGSRGSGPGGTDRNHSVRDCMVFGRCDDNINPPPAAVVSGARTLFTDWETDAKQFRRFEDEDLMYQTVTRNIEVTVSPRSLPERSSTKKNYSFGAYTVEITNRGKTPVQLKTRH